MANQIRAKIVLLVIASILLSLFMIMASVAQGQKNPAPDQTDIDALSLSKNSSSSLDVSGMINKSQLTLAEQKLGSDLLRLANSSFLLPGETQESLKAGMQEQKQLVSKAAAVKSMAAADQNGDLVYVYVFLNPGVSPQSISPYVSSLVSADDVNSLAVAWVNVSALEKLAAMDGVRSIRTVVLPRVCSGSVTAESDTILRTFDIRTTYGFSGSGIKVGVISDGVDHLANAQATDNLPSNVHVLSNSYGGDEGTAIMEIIYDETPGAELYFHDCGNNWIDFNSAIDELVANGCKVIVDDIYWADMPFFEDGYIASHISDLVNNHNIFYVTCAGNYAKGHYQGTYYTDGSTYWADLSHGTSPYKYIYYDVPPGGILNIWLQWNDPFAASNNDYDLFLYNYDGTSVLAYSTSIQSGTQAPYESIQWGNPSGSTARVILAVLNYRGRAQSKTLEIMSFSGGDYALQYNVNPADSVCGHAAVPNVVAVGAINAADPGNDNIEYYSSHGPSTIYTPGYQVRQKPDVCGIDGVQVSGAGNWGSYVSGHYYFFGTSAAAPSIAALAAQCWAAHPDLTASQVRAKLLSSAVDLGDAGNDYVFGSGRGDAIRLQQSMAKASVAGIVQTQYMAGIADARVMLVNATNHDIAYSTTRSDALGNYNLADIEVIEGLRYQVYANSTLMGSSYSNSFTLATKPPQVVVIVQTKPYQIQLTTNKSAVDISPDVIAVSAYMTDALNHPVSDGYNIVFTLNNSAGSFAAASGTAPAGLSYKTATSGGYATVRYGWAATEGATRITATFELDPLVNTSKNVTIVHMPPDGIRITTTSGVLYKDGDQALVTGQLYFNGLPCNKPGVTITFSINNSTVGYLPNIKTNVTDSSGQTMIILTTLSAGAVNVKATATAGNGSAIQNSTDVRVIPGGTISGLVQDKYLNGVASATVKLWMTTWAGSGYANTALYTSSENPQMTVSNPVVASVGSFNFSRIPPGLYNLTAEKTDGNGQNYISSALVSLGSSSTFVNIVMNDYIYVCSIGSKPIQTVPAPVMQGSHLYSGGISGRVTTCNVSNGIANAYIAVVNAKNTSQAYYIGQTDSQGYFQFTDVSNTWSAASGTYEPIYKLYVNHTLFGDGYSCNFSVEDRTTTAVNTVLVSSWSKRPSQLSGPAPGWPGRSIQYVNAPAMQGTQYPGAVVGRLTAMNTGNGIANAWVEIVNKSNHNQAYYSTRTDAQGVFQFVGINNTYNVTSGKSQPVYELYGFADQMGECYSYTFGVESNSTTPVIMAINPMPAHVNLYVSRDYINANGTDSIQVWAFVTDVLNNSVVNNTKITYTINSGYHYDSINNGSFAATPGQTAIVGTVSGYANTTFGWVSANSPGSYVTITASVPEFSLAGNSTRVFLHHKNVTPAISWFRTYGTDRADIGYSVRQTSDGGYVIAGIDGYIWDGNSSGYLVKTDENGNMQWEKFYDSSGVRAISDVQQAADGGFILAGSDPMDKPYIARTYANGSINWVKKVNNYGDNVNALLKTADGGCVITGRTNMNDMYLSRFYSNGTRQWHTTFGGSGDDSGFSVQQTADGGFILAGYYDISPPMGDWRVCLVRFDSDGNVLWSKTFSAIVREYGKSIGLTADGGYVIAGYSIVSDKDVDALLIRTDGSGGLLWRKTYNVTGCDYGNSVQLTRDGGFILAGYTDPHGSSFLIKTDASGNQLWNKTIGVAYDEAFSVAVSRDGGYVVTGNTISNGNLEAFLAKIGGINVALTGNAHAMPGMPYAGTVTVLDPDADTWNVIIDYGDGTQPLHMDTGALSFALPEHVYLAEGEYVINVTVRDNFGYVKSAYANVAVSESETLVMSLHKDWNLISIPFEVDYNSLSGIFPPDVLGKITDIWGWDESRQDWVYYSCDPDDYFYQYYPKLTELEPGHAYWVRMSGPASVTVTGTVPGYAPNSPATLVHGWNFVGLTGTSPEALVSMYPGATDVWGWDASVQNWVYYSCDPNDYFYQYYPKLNDISPGDGYWVRME